MNFGLVGGGDRGVKTCSDFNIDFFINFNSLKNVNVRYRLKVIARCVKMNLLKIKLITICTIEFEDYIFKK